MNLKSLVLTAGLFLGINSYSQNFELPHETDRYKFIPKDAYVSNVIIDTDYGFELPGIWYDKNCKNKGDYYNILIKSEGKIPKNEIFIDVDIPPDGILDISFKDLDDLIKSYILSIKLKNEEL